MHLPNFVSFSPNFCPNLVFIFTRFLFHSYATLARIYPILFHFRPIFAPILFHFYPIFDPHLPNLVSFSPNFCPNFVSFLPNFDPHLPNFVSFLRNFVSFLPNFASAGRAFVKGLAMQSRRHYSTRFVCTRPVMLVPTADRPSRLLSGITPTCSHYHAKRFTKTRSVVRGESLS